MVAKAAVVEEIALACASTSVALTAQSITIAPFIIAGTD
jgi:butyryl-CoA dehydrogenase